MNDSIKVTTKAKKYEKRVIKDKDFKYDIDIKEGQTIDFPKDAKKGETKSTNKLKVKVKKYNKDDKEVSGSEREIDVEVIYDGGVMSEGFKIEKLSIDSETFELKDPVSPGVKGWKTGGWVILIVGIIAVLAIIGGLIYWMTRSSNEE